MHSSEYVREFHEVFSHNIADEPTLGNPKLRLLRVRLIAEELCELVESLGIRMRIEAINGEYQVELEDNGGPMNIIETADALGDLDYVVQGSMLAFGLPAEDIVKEIHRSNMSKLGEDGKPIYREDGKVVKGPHYFRPNLSQVIYPEVMEQP